MSKYLRYLLCMCPARQRARSPEDKELRTAGLLDAARELGLERGVREVTLTAVTQRVGLHPSALRRYFESREELLLELAQEGWENWRDNLCDELSDARELTAGEIGDKLSGSLARLPLFCDLLTHVVLSLEGGVRLERVRRYKQASGAAYDVMTDQLLRTVPGIDRAGAQTILTTAIAAAAYLYQLSRPTPTLQQFYAEEPRWAHTALRFREQLTELLTAAARGAQHIA